MATNDFSGAPRALNDDEREEWIGHDEGLHDAHLASGLSMKDFIDANREKLDQYINAIRTNLKPAHFGKYGD